MRDHCAMSLHAVRGPFVIRAEPVDRLPVNQTDRQSGRRTAGKLGKWESWDSRQFWPLFAAVKLCQTSLKSAGGRRQAAETANQTNETKNLSAKIVLDRVFIVVQPGDLT